ncbi:MAG: AzlD domain-containing protein [Achromobacter sp.]|uniref:AzlD domain-containing protein n=1 Tax=Achromobacter sp. TaxID=134375 RepID=UPI003CFCF4F2
MNTDGLGFWGAVVAMAVITYLTRALPFMLSERSRLLRHLSREGSALAALGPSLLAGIAAAVIVPDLLEAGEQAARIGPYAGGLVVTAVAARLVGNTGVAVLLGMAGYGVLLALAA